MTRYLVAAAFIAGGFASAASGCGSTPAVRTVTVPAAAAPAARPASPPTTAAPPGPTATQERSTAKASLLTLGDLPSGWTASPSDGGDATSKCEAVQRAKTDRTARASSKDFSDGDNVPQVSETVYLYATEDQARAAFEELTTDSAGECFADQLDGLKTDTGATFRDPSSSELRVADVGDEAAATRAQATVDTSEGSADTYVDFITVREGRAVAETVMLDIYSPVDDDLRTSILRAADDRLDDALDEAND